MGACTTLVRSRQAYAPQRARRRSARGRTRTHNTRLRTALFYPIELRGPGRILAQATRHLPDQRGGARPAFQNRAQIDLEGVLHAREQVKRHAQLGQRLKRLALQ